MNALGIMKISYLMELHLNCCPKMREVFEWYSALQELV